ncbi:hypothetical protein FKX85_16575 [Echinicola soli]|uniref:Uncharacterized protein n=1 Tax=Echinicola soli TaxID=2591634 RepID=A0A514CL99_9BACT|nr:hypothetical protein [Echinicola soli]QDH80568.1 hypothetical protein FKX85_16575 [Echinicola soli]
MLKVADEANYPSWWGRTNGATNAVIAGIYRTNEAFASNPFGGAILSIPEMVGGEMALSAAVRGVKAVSKIGSRWAARSSTQGGLNLFKWGAPQTTKATGWKAGDYMLHLPNKGTPALNWKANYGALRSEMGLGKPIFDSYRLPNGNLIPTGGFLNAERSILQGRGWIYNPGSGAWMPPGF